MEFRRVIGAAAAARPVQSLFPRTVRTFSTTVRRAADEGKPATKTPHPYSILDAFSSGSQAPRHRAAGTGGMFGRNTMPIAQVLQSKPPKMGPTAGRSVVVTADVAQAFMRLRSILSQNRVQKDVYSQRFHERPGLKRKRLASERHRRRFKEGFKRMVSIVMDMKAKGM
ncbi:hypothetical protein FPQ18DRAFT_16464 [Pyronema domesticum]|uniref:Similar to 37S ribosomal protein MRP21, mitochondrial acc. no. P38175 n=1 Tax=Pyronema omphalodes (strain CBS 100304) TaxID=1076935 RepID=U4LI81_PYROM|nr:hypothetical protein FPQ18DRAFT_16464 [Pyronema domesticum]CCX16401.1 Similar to 37S ribosomal protein MRP21, mitochondrial; acc. no. P38175 [Pyronema omphalodes CBS 100304]